MNFLKFMYFLYLTNANILNNIKLNVKKIRSRITDINGFYGIVGPNINVLKTDTLYKLFTGDGIIQGVFLENGQINYVSHIVQTEKIVYEKKHGKFLNNMMMLPIYMFLNKIGIIPNVMGLANTAFISVNKRHFVLFERDLPYEIFINLNNKTINTYKKININDINYFSAHSTFTKNEKIYSLEYNVLKNIVSLFELNKDIILTNRYDIKTKYIPIIHDSYVLSNSIIFTDSPLQFSFNSFILGKIPVIFNNKNPTFIYEASIKTKFTKIYSTNESFYIFHYANVKETDEIIEILAPVYDNLDFSDITINGKYRKLILNKKTKKINIEKNEILEKYNLDFPVKWRNNIILRMIENKRINGFIICKDLNIKREIYLKEFSICGEPVVYDNGFFSRIICLGYNTKDEGYLLLINPENGEIFDFKLNEKVNIGFHSIFI